MALFNPNQSLFSTNFQTGNLQQDNLINAQLDGAQAARSRLMMSPIYGGYTEDQSMRALQSVGLVQGGSMLGSNGTLGGVSLDYLGLPSISSAQSGWGNDPFVQAFDSKAGSLLSLGYALAGPNGMPAQLDQKWKISLVQEQYAKQLQILQAQQAAYMQQMQQQQTQQQQAMMLMMLMMAMASKYGKNAKTGSTSNSNMNQMMTLMQSMMGGGNTGNLNNSSMNQLMTMMQSMMKTTNTTTTVKK